MSDDIRELYLRHREGQDKYVYFQLAAAAAALGFAVQKTEAMSLAWPMLPLGIAALCWAVSFFCGCKTIAAVQTALRSNVAILQLKNGSHPDQPDEPELVAGAIKGVTSALTSKAESAYRYGTAQFQFLVAGGVLFLAWHVLAMYCRTFGCDTC
ncbi:MAG: hypothetical protein ACREVI_08200 [Steroidobacteraceae bacterium]